MRILLVTHHAPPHIGGVEQTVLTEALAMVDAGHEVTWVTSDGAGGGALPPERRGLTIVRLPAWHVLERRFGVAYPIHGPGLCARLWREVGRADLVHAHGLVFPGSVVAATAARLRRRPCLLTDHGGLLRYRSRIATWTLRLMMATLGRLTARCSSRLIALNADLEALLRRLSGNPGKVQFLANPVDLGSFRAPSPDERRAARAALGWDDRPRVLCIGRLLPHKGIDVLVDAAAGSSFQVVFCGPGADDVVARLRARGAEVLPPRPQQELLPLYRAADAFALPSRNEGYPLVVQEALAMGLPVVLSDVPAYAPYRGVAGLSFAPAVAAAFRERIEAVLRDAPPAPAPAPPADAAVGAWLQRLLHGAV